MPGFKTTFHSILVATAISGLPGALWAAEAYTPSAFSATYEFDWQGGLSLSGSTVRELKTTGDNRWLFTSSASALFASIEESSEFYWQETQLRPLSYHYQKKALGKKRTAEVLFNWDNLEVTNRVENKPWQMAIKPGVQDKLSYQLLLQHEVAKGLETFSYEVADGGKLKTYQFEVEGKEQIDAPIGSFEAIRVKRVREEGSERETFIWFAPELNYQIIKLHQIEKKDKAYTLLLKALQ